jgi:hypothetical protein
MVKAEQRSARNPLGLAREPLRGTIEAHAQVPLVRAVSKGLTELGHRSSICSDVVRVTLDADGITRSESLPSWLWQTKADVSEKLSSNFPAHIPPGGTARPESGVGCRRSSTL